MAVDISNFGNVVKKDIYDLLTRSRSDFEFVLSNVVYETMYAMNIPDKGDLENATKSIVDVNLGLSADTMIRYEIETDSSIFYVQDILEGTDNYAKGNTAYGPRNYLQEGVENGLEFIKTGQYNPRYNAGGKYKTNNSSNFNKNR
jgi:hypothetical protein